MLFCFARFGEQPSVKHGEIHVNKTLNILILSLQRDFVYIDAKNKYTCLLILTEGTRYENLRIIRDE